MITYQEFCSRKTKSTPGLKNQWEFDNNFICINSVADHTGEMHAQRNMAGIRQDCKRDDNRISKIICPPTQKQNYS